MDAAPNVAAGSRPGHFPVPRTPGDPPVASTELLVVGVDDSDASVAALVWAIQHAVEEQYGLLVLTAWPLGRRTFVHEAPGHFNEARWEAREAQARAIARARSVVMEVPSIETALVNASTLDAILSAAAHGNLIVLGTDRADDEPSPSPSTSLTARAQLGAACPVILVPVTGPPKGRS